MKQKQFHKEALANMRNLGAEEIATKETELREELFWLGYKARSGQLDKPAGIRKSRRTLARVLTLRSERQRLGGTEVKK